MDGGAGSKSLVGATGVGEGWAGSVGSVDFGLDGNGGDSSSGSGSKSARPSDESSTVKVMSSSKSCRMVCVWSGRTSNRRAKVANILSCWARNGIPRSTLRQMPYNAPTVAA